MGRTPLHIIEITKENKTDPILSTIASIHKDTLTSGFLSTLGTPFLKTVYSELASDPNSQLICAFDGEDLVGFICGTTNTLVFYKRFIIRNALRVIWILLPRLFSLKFLKKVLETLFIPRQTQNIELPVAQLLNFCVSKNYQGAGIGCQLFNHLISWFQSTNTHAVTIITGSEQKQAQAFYHKQGLQHENSISLHDESQSYIYVWKSNILKNHPE